MVSDTIQSANELLEFAVRAGASDLYILPGRNAAQIRIKAAGETSEYRSVAPEQAEALTNRLKVMANLLTYRTDTAQDGAIRQVPGCGGAEFRLAVMPTLHGERITLRILRMNSRDFSLEALHFEPETMLRMRRLLDAESGLIVLTGPTGSGKTSTMYALLRELVQRRREDASSVISIEDPVECEIDGISQVCIPRENAAFGFAAALKAALRQDVKTIVIGEIRDRETLRTALEAAFTGHRVIASYHAGDVASVYARMLHQGFEPFLLAHAVAGVAAQRLIRINGALRVAAAVFQPDAVWRDFVAGHPTLEGLDEQLRAYPEADLARALERLKSHSKEHP